MHSLLYLGARLKGILFSLISPLLLEILWMNGTTILETCQSPHRFPPLWYWESNTIMFIEYSRKQATAFNPEGFQTWFVVYEFQISPSADFWMAFGSQRNLVSEYILHVKLRPLRNLIRFESALFFMDKRCLIDLI